MFSSPYKRYEKKPVFESGDVRAAMQVMAMAMPLGLIAGGVIGLVVGAGVALCATTLAGLAAAPLWGIGAGAAIGLFGMPALFVAGEAMKAVTNLAGGARNAIHDAYCFLTGKKNDKQPPAAQAASAAWPAISPAWQAEFDAWKLEAAKLGVRFSSAQAKQGASPQPAANAPAPKGPSGTP